MCYLTYNTTPFYAYIYISYLEPQYNNLISKNTGIIQAVCRDISSGDFYYIVSFQLQLSLILRTHPLYIVYICLIKAFHGLLSEIK